MRIVAIEAEPLDPTTGLRVPLRFVDTDLPEATVLNGEPCWPGITRNLALNREGWNGDWQNVVALPQAAVDVSLVALRKASAPSPRYRWSGAPLRIYSGEPGDLSPLFTGLVTEASIADHNLSVTAKVDAEPFLANALLETYDGRGGLGGHEDIAERPKPALFGYCLNVEPQLINEVDYIYQVHAYGPIESVEAVFERATDFGVGVGDFPSYEALLAATVPEGRWATCLAKGLLRMGAPPAGVLTCDVKGDNLGGFHQTTAAIISRILAIHGVDADRIDSASLAALAADVPFPVNVYVDQQETVMDLISRLCLPCNAQASLSWLGKLTISRFHEIPAGSALRLDAGGRSLPPVLSASEQAVSAPWHRLELQYARCWRVMSRDEIALEEDLPEPQPVTVWRRYPYEPPRPTGDGIPEGWDRQQPGPVDPQSVLDISIFNEAFPDDVYMGNEIFASGPIWRSGAMQRDGVTVGDWDVPTLADDNWQEWYFASTNREHHVQLATNALRLSEMGGTETSYSETIFIPQSIEGPFKLSWRVRSGTSMFVAGVTRYDPREVAATTYPGLSYTEIQCGFAMTLADQSQYHQQAASFSEVPETGVYPFGSDGDLDGGYNEGRTNAILLTTPPDNSLYEVLFNGESFELYLNGRHVRTYHQYRDYRLEWWPMFVPISPQTEIYDVQWEVAEAAESLPLPIDEMFGAIRIDRSRQAFELVNADPLDEQLLSGFGVGQVWFTPVAAGVAYSASVKAPIIPAVFEEPYWAAFFYLDLRGVISGGGEVGFQFSGRHGGGGGFFNTLPQTEQFASPIAFTDGDNFAIEYEGRLARYFRNGIEIKRTVTTAGVLCAPYLEMGRGNKFSDVNIIDLGSTPQISERGNVETTTFEATLAPEDFNIAIDGLNWAQLVETPDRTMTVTPFTDFFRGGTDSTGIREVSLVFGMRRQNPGDDFYASYRLERSLNGGSTWFPVTLYNTVTLYLTPEVQKASGRYLQADLTTETVRYRLLVTNIYHLGSTDTVEVVSGALSASWAS